MGSDPISGKSFENLGNVSKTFSERLLLFLKKKLVTFNDHSSPTLSNFQPFMTNGFMNHSSKSIFVANGKAFVANGFTSQFLLGVLHTRFSFETARHKRVKKKKRSSRMVSIELFCRPFAANGKAIVTNGLPVRREWESIRVSETNAFWPSSERKEGIQLNIGKQNLKHRKKSWNN